MQNRPFFTIFSGKAMFYLLQWIILQLAFKVSGSKGKTKNVISLLS